MGTFKDINKPIQRIKNKLPEYAQAFIDESLLHRSPKTVYEYSKGLCLFYDYLSKINSTEIKDIDISIIKNLSTSDIKKYQDYISAGNNCIKPGKYKGSVGATAVETKTICLRRFFSFLKTSDLIDADPTKDLLAYKPSKKEYEGRFVKDRELQDLLNAITEVRSTSIHSRLAANMTVKRDIAIVLLLHNAGLARQECVKLDLSDINLDKNTIRVVRDGEEKLIPMDEQTRAALQDYIENERGQLLRGLDSPALLISLQSNRMNPESIRHMLKKYGKSIGMSDVLTSRRLYGEKNYTFFEE